jgi:transcriptional regulator with XRE-family HTH domain
MEYLTDEQIGKIIKQYRISLDLTQGELGELIGVQAAAVQKWESGKVKNIKRSILRDLSRILKINPALLIGIATKELIEDEKSKWLWINK